MDRLQMPLNTRKMSKLITKLFIIMKILYNGNQVSLINNVFYLFLTLNLFCVSGNLNPYLTSYLRHHGYPDMEYSKSFWIIALSSALQGLGMSFGGVLQQKVGTRLAALFGCWIMR